MLGSSERPSRGGSWSRLVGTVSDALPDGHLSLDAVVAYVDEELPATPAQRAAEHVGRCLSCAAEVAAQHQARRRLQDAETPGVPSSLLSSLRAIPSLGDAPAPGADPGPGPRAELRALDAPGGPPRRWRRPF